MIKVILRIALQNTKKNKATTNTGEKLKELLNTPDFVGIRVLISGSTSKITYRELRTHIREGDERDNSYFNVEHGGRNFDIIDNLLESRPPVLSPRAPGAAAAGP